MGLLIYPSFVSWAQEQIPDPDNRNIRNGSVIYKDGYSDQPFVVATQDGHWLCVLTTGAGHEGNWGQHIIALKSKDEGATWKKISKVEPPTGPHASWAIPLVTPKGRVFVFYTYNEDSVSDNLRNDMLGVFAYKYSDDHGKTWSEQRYKIPVPQTSIDRANSTGGEQMLFWSVCKPFIHDDKVYITFTKRKDNTHGAVGEGFVLKGENITTAADPQNISWNMYPQADVGLKGPMGPVAEEHNTVMLSDGTLYTVYRTVDGYIGHAYSRDDGLSWTAPAHATYEPGGKRKIKQPRANARIEQFENGKYILWYHNFGGKHFKYPDDLGRNPVWISGGTEQDGYMHWSEPEILLYDQDPKVRISYPDWIHGEDKTWVTETQKSIARVHEVDPKLLQAVWNQEQANTLTRQGLVLEAGEKACRSKKLSMSKLDYPLSGNGLTIEMWVDFKDLKNGQTVLYAMDEQKRGVSVLTTNNRTVEIHLKDGQNSFSWFNDYEMLQPHTNHHIVFIVDGLSNIVSVVVDGVRCDGGEYRKHGWGRLPDGFGKIKWTDQLLVMPDHSPGLFAFPFEGVVKQLRIYDRYLLISEAIGNYQAERQEYK